MEDIKNIKKVAILARVTDEPGSKRRALTRSTAMGVGIKRVEAEVTNSDLIDYLEKLNDHILRLISLVERNENLLKDFLEEEQTLQIESDDDDSYVPWNAPYSQKRHE